MYSNIFSRLLTPFRSSVEYTKFPISSIHTICNRTPFQNPVVGLPAYNFMISIRTKIRNYFPRARENKRIRTHGYEKRMSTIPGRRVLMRRILKGRHVLSH